MKDLTSSRVTINSLATCVPKNQIKQNDVLERARAIFGARTSLFESLEPVFHNANIDTRYTSLEDNWFEQEADFKEKNKLFEIEATQLAKNAAEQALDEINMKAEDIDALIFVSSTGIATPSIDARLMNHMPFRSDVIRLPIFGLGCAGGVLGISRAAQMIKSSPNMNALIIVLELCTLAFRYDRLTKSNLVATALFGDGAAAMVISSSDKTHKTHSPALATFGVHGEHTWPDTLNIMGWQVDAHGFDVVFHRKIPEFVKESYLPALQKFLASHKLSNSDIDRPCCHPGGAKVIDALEHTFELPTGSLDAERKVLANYGNMSSPTVLFVLKELIDKNIKGRVLMSALGPGFTAAFQEIFLGENY